MDSSKLNKVVIGLVCLIVFLFIIILTNKSETIEPDTAKIELLGSEKVVVDQYETYIEYGYKIINKKYSGYHVDVVGSVTTDIVGTYYINYKLYSSDGELLSTATREVYVLEDDLSTTTIDLVGDPIEYYFVGDFVEHGVVAKRNGIDVTNTVQVESNINSNSAGNYKIEYFIASGKFKKKVSRDVRIVDLKVSKKINKNERSINLTINTRGIDHVVLPNGKETYSEKIIYKYDLNSLKDNYDFDVYLRTGSHRVYTVSLDELGAVTLSGTCKLSYTNNKTKISMRMDDISLVKKFTVNGKEFTGVTTTISGYKSSVTVKAYNYLNKVTSITCVGTPPTPTPTATATPKPTLDTGIKNIYGHSSGNFPCGYNITNDNIDLDNAVKQQGYRTRGGVMAAGLFLSNYKYNITYLWAGKYFQKGLNPRWGCGASYTNGLDCTGFVKWAFIQGGFDSNIIPRSAMEQAHWGDFNARNYLFAFNSENLNITSLIF